MGMRPMRHRPALVCVAAATAFVAALLLGPAAVSPLRLVRELFQSGGSSDAVRTIVWDLRLPRAVLAALVGAGLGLSGALLQAYFQNPMAGPYVVGVSSGSG